MPKKKVTQDKKWIMMVRKLPNNRRSLGILHELYEQNWWHLTRTYKGREGDKYKVREDELNTKELGIRRKLGMDAEMLEDCHFGSYDKFLLSRLMDCYTSRKNNRKHLTQVDSCDILDEFEGDMLD